MLKIASPIAWRAVEMIANCCGSAATSREGMILGEYVDASGLRSGEDLLCSGENKERLSKRLQVVETLTKKGYDVLFTEDVMSLVPHRP